MAQIPGLTAGQYYQPGAVPGYSMNVPRDWSQGGKQYYDPKYAVQLPQAQPNTAYYANTQGGAGARYNQFQPKTGSPKQTAQQPSGQGGFNIQTGITAGPAVPQAQVQATQQRLQNYQAPSPGDQYAPFMQHLNSLVGGALGTAATDFGRDASFANAQHLLASQKAQAGAGTGWGSAMLGDYASRMGTQGQGLNALLALLQSFMV